MLEVRERNIRVITVCPGSVDTDFSGPSERRPGVIPTAEEIARVCVDAVTMPRHVMVSEIDVRPTNPKG
jgi:NADP-dependent 3-hydroxy acid dehydrogenase YdfG